MAEQTNTRSTLVLAHHPVPNFSGLLAIGAMLATLAVVAYACLQSDDSSLRVRLILQGADVVLLTWAAGLVASALQWISLAGDSISRKLGLLSSGDSIGI